jgi:hypothetical protein
MSLLSAIRRHLSGDFDAILMDHAPVDLPDAHVTAYRHHCKLQRAADRFGRAFKCAADGIPRERFVGSKLEIVGQTDAQPKPTSVNRSGVHILKRAK